MWLCHGVMSPKNADGMANSVDTEQTAPLGAVWSGSTLLARAYLSEHYSTPWERAVHLAVLTCCVWWRFMMFLFLSHLMSWLGMWNVVGWVLDHCPVMFILYFTEGRHYSADNVANVRDENRRLVLHLYSAIISWGKSSRANYGQVVRDTDFTWSQWNRYGGYLMKDG